MTTEKYNRAREIKSIQSYLEDLRLALCVPHPRMVNKHENDTICFIGLGKKYEDELKELMTNFLLEKSKELDKEFDEL